MKKNLKTLLSGIIISSIFITPMLSNAKTFGEDKATSKNVSSSSNASNSSNTSKSASIDFNNKEIFTHIIKEDKDSITIKDARDKEVTIKKNPKRVICVYNSFLDLWYKSGGTVIGKAEESKDKIVKGAKDAEVVGKPSAPSLEKITSLEPDLVILSTKFKAHVELAKQLEEQGVSILVMDPTTLNDYLELTKIYTSITNRGDLLKTLANDVKGEIDDIIKRVPKDKDYKAAIILASTKNLSLRTSKTTVGLMIKDLNVTNIADAISEDKASIDFSLEKLIEEDPDFIFVTNMGSDIEAIKEKIKKDDESNEAWASLKAVKNGNYIVLPKDLYMYDPNDRYAEAYLGLAKIIYKDVFK